MVTKPNCMSGPTEEVGRAWVMLPELELTTPVGPCRGLYYHTCACRPLKLTLDTIIHVLQCHPFMQCNELNPKLVTRVLKK